MTSQSPLQSYFRDTFKQVTLSDGTVLMQRGDPLDQGAAYRNVLGIPGGIKGPLYASVVKYNIHGMRLIEGGLGSNGPMDDTIDEGVVYIYCSILNPFYRAEQFHMFHPNVVLKRDLPPEYQFTAQAAAVDRGWINKTCAEVSSGTRQTNVETISPDCSAVCLANGQFLNGHPQKGCSKTTGPDGNGEQGGGGGKGKGKGKRAAIAIVLVLLVGAAGSFAYVKQKANRRRTYEISYNQNNDDDDDNDGGDEDLDVLIGADDGEV